VIDELEISHAGTLLQKIQKNIRKKATEKQKADTNSTETTIKCLIK